MRLREGASLMTARVDKIASDLKRLAVPLEKLQRLPDNPRRGDVESVKRSYERFGQRKPIVATGNRSDGGVVSAGNHQLDAARELGWTHIAVVFTDDTEAEALAFAITDNHTSELGTNDDERLAAMLTEIRETDVDLFLATSYDDKGLKRLVSFLAREGQTDPDDVPALPAKPRTKPGDVWLCGEHRVMCGDATTNLLALMQDDRACLVVTSPPYNQGIDKFTPSGMHKEADWVAKVGRLAYSDSMPEPDYQSSQRAILATVYDVVADGASFFYNHKNRYRGKQVISPFEWLPGPFKLRQEIIWRRPGSVTQNARMFLPCDERVYWLYKGDDFSFSDTIEIKSWSSVWDISPQTNKEHAVAFPVELPTRCIQACSDPDGIVLDPYGGSGTTLIACEQTGRRAYLMEIDPHYCDVIARRFQEFTGTLPILERTGKAVDFT